MSSSQPVACSLTDPELRKRLDHLRRGLFAHTRSVRETTDGYTFTFDNTDENVAALLEVVLLERQCCPFLHFRSDIPPQPEILALQLCSTGETREFVEQTFVSLVPQKALS